MKNSDSWGPFDSSERTTTKSRRK